MQPEIILETEDALVRIMPLSGMAETGWHHHNKVVDTMVAMRGTIAVECHDPYEQHTLNPGEHCRVPAGREHRVVNLGATPASYLLIQGVGAYDYIAKEPGQ